MKVKWGDVLPVTREGENGTGGYYTPLIKYYSYGVYGCCEKQPDRLKIQLGIISYFFLVTTRRLLPSPGDHLCDDLAK